MHRWCVRVRHMVDEYSARVMAILRYPMPDEDDAAVDGVSYEEAVYATNTARQEYIEQLLHQQELEEEAWQHRMNGVDLEEWEDQLPDYPDLVLDELRSVADQIAELERYRDRLLIFARLFAVQPHAARSLANVVGLSYSTILRNADEQDVAYVQAEAQRQAASLLSNGEGRPAGISNPSELEAYQRLRALAGPAPAGEGRS